MCPVTPPVWGGVGILIHPTSHQTLVEGFSWLLGAKSHRNSPASPACSIKGRAPMVSLGESPSRKEMQKRWGCPAWTWWDSRKVDMGASGNTSCRILLPHYFNQRSYPLIITYLIVGTWYFIGIITVNPPNPMNWCCFHALILHMKKLRLESLRNFVQGHRTHEWWRRSSNLGIQVLRKPWLPDEHTSPHRHLAEMTFVSEFD